LNIKMYLFVKLRCVSRHIKRGRINKTPKVCPPYANSVAKSNVELLLHAVVMMMLMMLMVIT